MFGLEKKKISSGEMTGFILLPIIIGIARKMEITPREFVEAMNDSKANNDFIGTCADIMAENIKSGLAK